ncbi:MAG: 50S ribosomal protein L5 [Candidatus Chisholmbacteria bacterium RIFCSPHIGHO2_01_FULL_48_12]|uniref:Large ribosomal subunit protein uL5 n=1 Tax=Candidatus Chisholmbacteria bacterium RIFCSPHIGHO2_01_FULL_48_12 TaxID=1797589 RepID=A0A1G1VKD4_9BACT|nr:MAG: 50S ribosomal protein L5 [Candidatus Chisholmbacteria bacterium RIFCSPHIGHO2_01_FULL_48_12]
MKQSPRLQLRYEQQIRPALAKELGLNNVMAVPKVNKVVINTGIAEDQYQDKALESMRAQLGLITGQKPADAMAKKSIAEFKIRAGQVIGLKVTLRGKRMYQFLDKLVSVVLPQIKDFSGVNPNSFDGKGNYTLGFREQIVFPELTYDTIDKIRSLEITLVTSAKTDGEARQLLQALGVPFSKESHGQEK